MTDPLDTWKSKEEDAIIARSEEASTVLSAWQSAFGTTQLSHAIAERDSLKKVALRSDNEFQKVLVERDQLRAKCERLEGALVEIAEAYANNEPISAKWAKEALAAIKQVKEGK